jgi:hypothetical protein
MKVSEIIQEFIPCEICGNSDLNNFYFHVTADKGTYVKCCECEEEYYSITARNILVLAKEARKARKGSRINLQNRNHESVHPLIKVLAQI